MPAFRSVSSTPTANSQSAPLRGRSDYAIKYLEPTTELAVVQVGLIMGTFYIVNHQGESTGFCATITITGSKRLLNHGLQWRNKTWTQSETWKSQTPESTWSALRNDCDARLPLRLGTKVCWDEHP